MSLPTTEEGARNYEYARRQQAAAEATERLRALPDVTTTEVAQSAGTERTTKEPTMADQPDLTQFNARVSALRVAHPTMSLAEAKTIAHDHAAEEGYYAPPVGDGPLTSKAVNGPEEPTLLDLFMEDAAKDPRVADALRWDALTDSEKEDERVAGQKLKALKAYRADEVDRAKAAGTFAQPMEVLITNADAPAGVRKAMRALWEAEATAATVKANEPSVADLLAAVDAEEV